MLDQDIAKMYNLKNVNFQQFQSVLCGQRGIRALLSAWFEQLQAGSCSSWAPSAPSEGGFSSPGFPPRGRFGAEQQSLPPPAQVTCSTARAAAAAPPIVSPSLMIPQAGFTPHQPNTPVHLHHWPQQQLQQHRLYLQVLQQGSEQAQGWLRDGLGFLEEMGLIWLIRPGQCLCTSSVPVVSPHSQVLSFSRLTLHLLKAIFSSVITQCTEEIPRFQTQLFIQRRSGGKLAVVMKNYKRESLWKTDLLLLHLIRAKFLSAAITAFF